MESGKGLSNHRWIVGGKLCLVLNQYGLVVGWDCATANVPQLSEELVTTGGQSCVGALTTAAAAPAAGAAVHHAPPAAGPHSR